MKILILSDSHSSLSFMRQAIAVLRPDGVVHLGDYYQDGMQMAKEHPALRFYQVAGNCDAFDFTPGQEQILSYPIGGVQFYMTHGHRHGVKTGLEKLLTAARASAATIVLYGHTHRADCHQEEDGLWVLNPGSCSGYGGSVGLVELENHKIMACRILQQADLEDYR